MMWMKSNTVIRVCSLMVMLLLVGGEVAQARPSRSVNGDGLWLAQRQRGQNRLMEDLNLSDQQQQQIQGIRDRYQPEINRLRDQMRQAHEQLRTLMTGSASESQISAQHDRVQQLHQQMGDLRFQSFMEIRNVLDPTQRQQLAERMTQMRGNRDRQPGSRNDGWDDSVAPPEF